MATIRELLVSIGVDADNKKLTQFDKGLKGVKNSANSLIGVVGALTAAIGGITIGSLVKSSIDLAASIDNTEAAFTALIGNADKAKIAIQDLRDFVRKTPFEFTEAKDLATGLLAVGFKPTELIDSLSAIGDVAAVLGKEKLPQITYAVQQIRSKGRLMGQELTQQLGNAGVPLADLAKNLGITTAQLADAGRLNISFERFWAAFKKLSQEGGRFYNGMAQLQKKWTGQLSETRDTFDEFKTSFGSAFIEVMLPILKDFNKWLGDNRENIKNTFKEWGQSFGNFVKFFAEHTTLLKVIFGGFATIFIGLMTIMIAQIWVFVAGIYSAIAPFLPLIAVIWAVFAGLTALGILIYNIVKDWDAISQKIIDGWKSVVNYLETNVMSVGSKIAAAWGDAFQSATNFIGSKVKEIFGFAAPLLDIFSQFSGSVGIKGFNAPAFNIPTPATASAIAPSANYTTSSNADNRQYNVNMTVNNARNGQQLGNDFFAVLEGVQ